MKDVMAASFGLGLFCLGPLFNYAKLGTWAKPPQMSLKQLDKIIAFNQ